ncbi:hypothetical protein DXK93_28290 [Achromobacter sp. K91]|nr:hypothetical protein DAI43_17815 [Achromobacter xylosoxidans]RII99953.1 hypothetical protein DXK93_28290 [Achromobacter sp. K91]RSE97515.1 hypothetical protein EGU54_23855 [Achromobacter aegrifaciens]
MRGGRQMLSIEDRQAGRGVAGGALLEYRRDVGYCRANVAPGIRHGAFIVWVEGNHGGSLLVKTLW